MPRRIQKDLSRTRKGASPSNNRRTSDDAASGRGEMVLIKHESFICEPIKSVLRRHKIGHRQKTHRAIQAEGSEEEAHASGAEERRKKTRHGSEKKRVMDSL